MDTKTSLLAIFGILILNVGLAYLLHRLGRTIHYNRKEGVAMASILVAFVLVTFVAAGMSFKTYDNSKQTKQIKRVGVQGEFSLPVFLAQLMSSVNSRLKV